MSEARSLARVLAPSPRSRDAPVQRASEFEIIAKLWGSASSRTEQMSALKIRFSSRRPEGRGISGNLS
eukprot:3393672-Pyramimonas_sp.AAC.1